MYITCHECNTVFRLDERRLKPAGSKVRCSQCGNIFTAFPQVTGSESEPQAGARGMTAPVQAAVQAGTAFAAAAEPAQAQTQLEGIDLAALDALLDTQPNPVADRPEPPGTVPTDDLDLDFDMDLDGSHADSPVSGQAAAETDPASGKTAAATEAFDDLDLEMDFDLEDGADAGASADAAPRDALAEDLAAHAKSRSSGAGVGGSGRDSGDTAPASTGRTPAKESPIEDDLDLDLDFELADDAPHAAPPAAKAEASPEAPPKPAVPAGEDIDLADLGDLIDDAEDKPDAAEREEVELELDLPGEKETPAAGAAPSGEALDLSGDLGDMLDILDEEPSGPQKIDGADSKLDPGKEAAPSADATKSQPPDDDLNLDDLAAILGDEPEPDSDKTPQDEPELELELDSGPQFESEKEAPAELDLGDLDSLLADSPPAEADAASQDKPGEAADEGLEELEFELDAEFEDKPIARQQGRERESSQDAPELDLSDIEEMLEGGGLAVKPGVMPQGGATGTKDLGDLGELDLGEIEKAIDADDQEAFEPMAEDEEQELDFSFDDGAAVSPRETSEDPMDLDLDIVATMAPIDQNPDQPAEQAPPSQSDDLVLDLEMDDGTGQAETAAPSRTAAKDDDLDLSDLGDLVQEADAVKSDTIDTGDIELEFEIEDAAEPIIAQTSARASRPVNEMAAVSIAEEEEAVEPVKKKPAGRPRAARKKKGASKLLLALLLLVVLGGGLYYVIKYDVQIPYASPYIERYITPYVGQYINPKPVDPEGIANLSTTDINSKFIENELGGRLFIITGNVRSGYADVRNNIQIRGKLYGAGKILVKTEQTYAGQQLSDQELAAKPVDEIKQQLSRAPGLQLPFARLMPGKSVPFMVVFSELPDNLDEFAIEVIRSQKAQ